MKECVFNVNYVLSGEACAELYVAVGTCDCVCCRGKSCDCVCCHGKSCDCVCCRGKSCDLVCVAMGSFTTAYTVSEVCMRNVLLCLAGTRDRVQSGTDDGEWKHSQSRPITV